MDDLNRILDKKSGSYRVFFVAQLRSLLQITKQPIETISRSNYLFIYKQNDKSVDFKRPLQDKIPFR